ncbi:Serine dehydratase [Balamuthia mandrillaris]
MEEEGEGYPYPDHIGIEQVREAQERIEGHAHRTPVLTCNALDRLAGRQLFFKCENFQKVGAFKFRGAFNAVAKLSEEAARKGVVTHSSGNHAQALALAAKLRGIPAYVVMPVDAPAVKKAAVREYGATIIDCTDVSSRQPTADRVAQETGATFIHPYNNPDIIAGQGTMALEILAQVEDLDAIVAPIGGGGMISGICVAAKALKPDIHIIAAEPKDADDAWRSKQEGRLVPQTGTKTIADGLRTGLGSLTWPIVREHVTAVVTVSEEDIKAAMRLIWERMKVVVEPSAGVGLAAVLRGKEFQGEGHAPFSSMKRICVVLCGGNVDLDNFSW